ncbi:MAG: hypothetical protein IPM29_10700 [Planctomycetes bacterium]|nr:hypothetical protein [Planctomycetota bacterium]
MMDHEKEGDFMQLGDDVVRGFIEAGSGDRGAEMGAVDMLASAVELARRGRYTEAERLLSVVERAAPRLRGAALDLQARIHSQQGRMLDAEKCWTEALRLEPGNVEYRRSLDIARQCQRPWSILRPITRAMAVLSLLLVVVVVGGGGFRSVADVGRSVSAQVKEIDARRESELRALALQLGGLEQQLDAVDRSLGTVRTADAVGWREVGVVAEGVGRLASRVEAVSVACDAYADAIAAKVNADAEVTSERHEALVSRVRESSAAVANAVEELRRVSGESHGRTESLVADLVAADRSLAETMGSLSGRMDALASEVLEAQARFEECLARQADGVDGLRRSLAEIRKLLMPAESSPASRASTSGGRD